MNLVDTSGWIEYFFPWSAAGSNKSVDDLAYARR